MVEISLLENLIDLKKPRRLMKYIVVWCASGKVTLTIDEKDFELRRNQVVTITSGQIHCFRNAKNAKGYVLEFTLDFFCKDDRDIELIFHNGLFCHFVMNEVTTMDNGTVKAQLDLIKDELVKQPHQYLTSIHSRIELILVEINRAKVRRGGEIYRPEALFLKFLELVRANFENNFPLSRYARLLGTTRAKLNEQAKAHAGKTAQSVIYGLVISEAKRFLTYEHLSVKEVAYKLGFKDPFYFSNFFKKHTRLSPKSYQRKYGF